MISNGASIVTLLTGRYDYKYYIFMLYMFSQETFPIAWIIDDMILIVQKYVNISSLILWKSEKSKGQPPKATSNNKTSHLRKEYIF